MIPKCAFYLSIKKKNKRVEETLTKHTRNRIPNTKSPIRGREGKKQNPRQEHKNVCSLLLKGAAAAIVLTTVTSNSHHASASAARGSQERRVITLIRCLDRTAGDELGPSYFQLWPKSMYKHLNNPSIRPNKGWRCRKRPHGPAIVLMVLSIPDLE